jgi:hypothetical protein
MVGKRGNTGLEVRDFPAGSKISTINMVDSTRGHSTIYYPQRLRIEMKTNGSN